jgi:hypothetical protein
MAWAPDYASTTELAAFVRIGDSVDDAQIGLALAAASRAIDQATGRQFGRVTAPTARYYTARWEPRRGGHWGGYRTHVSPYGGYAGRWQVGIDDLMTSTDLVVAFDGDEDQSFGSSITDYQLGPVNAAADGRPWTELQVRPASTVQPTACENGLRITARWGWSGVPDPIRQACLLQASRLLARRNAPFGVAGSPDAGSEVRLLARLDPDVAVAVRPFRRTWGAV